MSDAVREYQLEGMHCAACKQKIESATQSIPGVERAEVELAESRLTLTLASENEGQLDQPSFDSIRRAVRAAGEYDVVQEAPTTGPSTSKATSGTQASASPAPNSDAESETLYPLFLIVGYLVLVVVLVAVATGVYDWRVMMRHFMAGFFLVFSFFKLLDLRGFVESYRAYDFLAQRSASWATAYPFVELVLGICYLVNFATLLASIATLLLMVVGAAGVLRALMDKKKIRCACLGNVLRLPMTTVTLVEDLLMAAMAAIMIFYM